MDVVKDLGTIRFLSGPRAGEAVQIDKTTITIGRDPSNDLVIDDPTVSRHHARLLFNESQWSIEKLAQQNSLTINRQEVQQAIINDRDTISIGPGTSFRFTSNVRAKNNDQHFISPAPPSPGQQHAPGSPASASPQFSPSQAGPAVPPFQAPVSPTPLAGQAPPPSYPYVAVPQPIQDQPHLLEEAPTQRVVFGGAGGVPSLEISNNIHPGKKTYDLTKQVINIGRDPSNDIVIEEPLVSAFHLQIVRNGNELILVHPHPSRPRTANGLFYQGRHIAGDEAFRKTLTRGDIFRIGDEHGTLVNLTFNDGSGAVQDIAPEIRPIPLGAALLTIGRSADNGVVLNHPQVSGHHARLEQVQGGYRIVDLNSTNHVYINGQQVSNQLLKPGDEVRIGPFKLIYTGTQLTQHDEQGSIRIDALHLKKVGNRDVILINDISVAIPPRKFVALVGGSGAGKSTLMDALNGLRPAQQGVVLYNGQNYYHNLASFSTQLGYVPQDDIIHRDLTVEHALYYAAKLRLPEDFTTKQVKQRIEEVLADVEMTHQRHQLVSKLSGGQRKRVSIALELLANPSVFFLDEPTSGLDPGLDRKMMSLLRNLTDKGHTIVLVTHATNNINSCDYVCFLARGGRLAYYGPPDEAKTYFSKADFAEIYSALEPTEENPNIPAQAEEKFKASPDFQKYVVAPLNQGPAGRANLQQQQTGVVTLPKRGNPWKQFWILSRRTLELLRNDRVNLAILLLQAPVIGIILFFLAKGDIFFATSVADCPTRANITDTSGPIISHDCERVVIALNSPQGQQFANSQGKSPDQLLNDSIRPGAGEDAQKILFIMAFAAVFFGCINGSGAIVKEVAIYRRERAVNLGIVPYLSSKIVVLGVLCLLQSAVLVFFVNLRAPLQRGVLLDPLLEIYITVALTSLAGLMLGLMVSATAPNNDRALSIIPIIVIAQVIFSGIIFPLDNFFLKFIGLFFASGWAMAGLGTSMGLHSDKLGQDDCSYVTSPGNCAYRGDLFVSLNQAGAHAAAIFHLLIVWFALIVMCVAFAALTGYFLKRKDVRG
jgi:ABC-type multidrug transport system ATPase subunit/pSer/pThr/pTyr-binding forkhead associated (FHA) protein